MSCPAERALARGDENEALRLLEDVARAATFDYFAPVGMDTDDLLQEARYGILKSFRYYSDDGASGLRNFARLAAVRQVITAIKTARRRKHLMLVDAVSLDEEIEPGLERGQVVVGSDGADREVIHRETLASAVLAMRTLTSLERTCLLGRIEGRSYREIGAALGVAAKAVDNALSRCDRKLDPDAYYEAPETLTRAVPRRTGRVEGLSEEQARLVLRARVVPAVRTPEGTVILDRRRRHRVADPNRPVWVNVRGE